MSELPGEKSLDREAAEGRGRARQRLTEARTPVPPMRFVKFDLACKFCGYNLRTLALAGRCPECGRDVIETAGVLAQNSQDAAWLKAVGAGLTMIVLLPCAYFGVIAVALLVARLFDRNSEQVAGVLLCAVSAYVLLAGFLFNRNRPGWRKEEERFAARLLALLGVICGAAAPFTLGLAMFFYLGGQHQLLYFFFIPMNTLFIAGLTPWFRRLVLAFDSNDFTRPFSVFGYIPLASYVVLVAANILWPDVVPAVAYVLPVVAAMVWYVELIWLRIQLSRARLAGNWVIAPERQAGER